MDFITDEFIHARTGESLEARIRKNEEFQQQKKSLDKVQYRVWGAVIPAGF